MSLECCHFVSLFFLLGTKICYLSHMVKASPDSAESETVCANLVIAKNRARRDLVQCSWEYFQNDVDFIL